MTVPDRSLLERCSGVVAEAPAADLVGPQLDPGAAAYRVRPRLEAQRVEDLDSGRVVDDLRHAPHDDAPPAPARRIPAVRLEGDGSPHGRGRKLGTGPTAEHDVPSDRGVGHGKDRGVAGVEK